MVHWLRSGESILRGLKRPNWLGCCICIVFLHASLFCCAAKAQDPQVGAVVTNYKWGFGPDGINHTFKIATLPASSANTSDHLHLVATLNTGEWSYTNSYIDVTFANRQESNNPSFSWFYNVRGAPATGSIALIATQAYDGGSVDIWLCANNTYGVGGYTILENWEETAYSSPVDTQGQLTGQIVFNSADPEDYPPHSYESFNDHLGIGTSNTPLNSLSTASGINVDQNDDNDGGTFIPNTASTRGISFGYASGEGIGSPRVSGAPNQYGLDFFTGFTKRMSITNGGNVGIGTITPGSSLEVNGNIAFTRGSGAALVFPDGTTQSTAYMGGNNLGVGTTTANSWSGITNISGSNLQVSNGGTNARIVIDSGVNDGAELHFIDGAATTDQHNHRFYADNRGLVLDQPADSYSSSTVNMFWENDGKVGIGTTFPTAALDVAGNVHISGSGASLQFPDGTFQSTAYTGNCSTSGGDYAESVDVSGEKAQFAPGDVIVIDPGSPGHFIKSSARYSTLVAGIYSTKPGYVGRRQTTDAKTSTTEIPMAMVGIVPTKVTAENGPIKVGDLLVTASTLGYAMHGTDPGLLTGAVVGKALGKLDSGTGVIEVLVSLQ